MIMKRLLVGLISIMMAFLMLGAFVGCKGNDDNGGNGGDTPPVVKASYVYLDMTQASIDLEETLKLSVITDGADDSVRTWSSSNTSVATVSADGTVTAISVGSTSITVTLDEKTATCTINVYDSYPYPVIAVDTSNVKLNVGDTFKIDAKVIFRKNVRDVAITYSSADDNVATVSNDGTITAVGVGLIKVTLNAEYEGSPLQKTINVAVLSDALLN